MFKYLSKLKNLIIEDNDKHNVTIASDEMHIDTTPIEKLEEGYKTNIIHIYGDIDHLHIDGNHTIIVHGNINGNVHLYDNSWLTCESVEGIVKGDKAHVDGISDKEKREYIIYD